MTCNNPTPGELRFHCEIFSRSLASSDGIGGYNRSWASLGETRVKMSFSARRDHVTGQFLTQSQDVKITMRSSVPMQEKYRVTIQGADQYECIGMDPSEIGRDFKTGYFRRVQNEQVQ